MGVSIGVRAVRPGLAVVSLRGELDLAARDQVRDALVVAADGGGLLVVDLRDVSFLDSTGLGLLVAARRHTRAAGGSMVVVNPRPAVRRVFQVAGLLDALPVRTFDSTPARAAAPAGGLPRQLDAQQRQPASGAS